MADIKPDSGVFIVKGDAISIPSFSISMNEQGEFQVSPVVLHVGIDMTGYWLEIAYRHLLDTESAHKKLMLAKEEGDNERISRYLRKESISGMQSIMASGIALDAYYASIKEHIIIPKSTFDTWRESKLARYKQITEVIRIGFRLKDSNSEILRNVLKKIFKFRDLAVHPSPGTAEPSLHVELNKFTDWRYAAFRFSNTKMIYGWSLSVVSKTMYADDVKVAERLKTFCEKMVPRIEPLERKWKKRFGELL